RRRPRRVRRLRRSLHHQHLLRRRGHAHRLDHPVEPRPAGRTALAAARAAPRALSTALTNPYDGASALYRGRIDYCSRALDAGRERTRDLSHSSKELQMQTKSIRRLALVSALAIATPLAVMAQQVGNAGPGERGPGAHKKGHFHKGHHGHHGNFHRAGMHSGHMLRGLDLTQAQRDKLFELRHAQAPKVRELGKTLRSSRQELRQLSMSDSFDNAKAKQLADSASQAGAELALLRAQLQNETFKILTPEQREKLAKRAEPRKRGMKGPRGGSDEARS